MTDFPSVEFPNLWDHFGGSVFWDDFYGDLTRCEGYHKSLVASADSDPDNTELRAAELLFKTVWQILKGDIVPALASATRLSQERPQTDVWNKRGVLFRLFLVCHDLTPPAFAYAPEGDGFQRQMWRTEDYQEWDQAQTLYGYCEEWTRPLEGTNLAALEMGLTSALYIYSMALGGSALKLNPQTPAFLSGQQAFQRSFVDEFVSLSTRHAQNLSDAGLSRLAPIPKLRICHLFRAMGDPQTDSHLQEMEKQSREDGEAFITALCLMFRGDSLLSIAASHITALNLILVEGGGSGLENARWDREEPCSRRQQEIRMRSGRSDVARALYQEGLALARRENAWRLAAAIHLRLGCLIHLKAHIEGSHQEAAAAEDLEQAEQLFDRSGDPVGRWLVRTHKLLLAILRRDRASIVIYEEEVRQWYKTSGYRPFAFFLGLLIARFGLRHRVWYDIAEPCFTMARKLFQMSQNPMSAFQVQVQQAKLLAEGGDMLASRQAIAAAQGDFDRLVAEWDQNQKLVGQLWYNPMRLMVRRELETFAATVEALAGT